ncbi:hypothetical protein WHR41_01069 [Cladosporium halotolerans]|uniref:Autophagy-related protein 16 domain-containing protein n=1 Tax=Cladosporium halotolerans TaxID=1052096 RepID=A0AB34L283_9PEZI
MADWIQQYTAALEERDAREQAHKPYIDAYTALADRQAQLSAPPPASAPASPNPQAQLSSSRESSRAPNKPSDPSTAAATSDLLSTLRADLTSTQKARLALQNQLADLTAQLSALTLSQRTSAAQIAALTKGKLEAERKLRDRDEELRGKNKMVEQAQDEMVAQGLQMNLAEQRSERLERENRELVERWMKRMGEEAERVNRDSRWE